MKCTKMRIKVDLMSRPKAKFSGFYAILFRYPKAILMKAKLRNCGNDSESLL